MGIANTNYPLVSIIIPVYNGSNYIYEAIESAINQTYSNIEIIVVNDGSNDQGQTREECIRFKEKIRYFEKENGGVSSALNYGISVMEGEYFSWLSHDDVYMPTKVENSISAIFSSSSKNCIVFTNYMYIDSRGRKIKTTHVNELGNSCAMYSVLMGNINGCTMLIPKRCFDVVGIFDESLITIQDYELFAKLAKLFTFIHVPEVLVKSRIHELQQGKTKQEMHIASADAFFSRLIEECGSKKMIGLAMSEPKFYILVAYRMFKNNYLLSSDIAKNVGIKKVSDQQVIIKIIHSITEFYFLVFKIRIWKIAYCLYKKIRRF